MNLLSNLQTLLGMTNAPRAVMGTNAPPMSQADAAHLAGPSNGGNIYQPGELGKNAPAQLTQHAALPLLQYLSMLGRNGKPTGVYPGAPLGGGRRIPAKSADGYWPQNPGLLGQGLPDLQGMGNSTSMYDLQPTFGEQSSYQPNNISGGNYADPFGWNNTQGVVKNFRIR